MSEQPTPLTDRERRYVGKRTSDAGPSPVWVEEQTDEGEWKKTKDLPPRTDLRNHSPSGFAWGYGGSGPAQLALAILAYEYDDDVAVEHAQTLKWELVANLTTDTWQVYAEQIPAWLPDDFDE